MDNGPWHITVYLTKPLPGHPLMTEMYLSQGVGGCAFPYPSYAVYLAFITASLSTLLSPLNPFHMAYYNNTNNTSFYSTPFASGGFYSYPHPTQTFFTDTEEANGQIYADSTDQWSAVRSGPMVGSPTSVRATDSFGERRSDYFIDSYLTRESTESMAPTTSYTSGTSGYSWPSYDQSADYRQTQSHHSDFLSRDGSFASTTASETSTAIHTPSSGEYSLEEFGAHRSQTVPLDYWGSNQSGASTSTSYMVSARV